jgi:hypothetical protein
MAIEIKKHRLVLRHFFHGRSALQGGRVPVKKHPTEGAVLERFSVACEIVGFMRQSFMWRA